MDKTVIVLIGQVPSFDSEGYLLDGHFKGSFVKASSEGLTAMAYTGSETILLKAKECKIENDKYELTFDEEAIGLFKHEFGKLNHRAKLEKSYADEMKQCLESALGVRIELSRRSYRVTNTKLKNLKNLLLGYRLGDLCSQGPLVAKAVSDTYRKSYMEKEKARDTFDAEMERLGFVKDKAYNR
jgi:hypothetical protein